MTTKVINVEDAMPYVEPKPPVGLRGETFLKSIELSHELQFESAGYYEDSKSFARANVHKDAASVLEDVINADYPESKLESILDRLRRVYMELTMAQTEAQDACARAAKKASPALYSVPKEEPKSDVSVLTDADRKRVEESIKRAEASKAAWDKKDADDLERVRKMKEDAERRAKHLTPGAHPGKEVVKVDPKALTAGTKK